MTVSVVRLFSLFKASSPPTQNHCWMTKMFHFTKHTLNYKVSISCLEQFSTFSKSWLIHWFEVVFLIKSTIFLWDKKKKKIIHLEMQQLDTKEYVFSFIYWFFFSFYWRTSKYSKGKGEAPFLLCERGFYALLMQFLDLKSQVI